MLDQASMHHTWQDSASTWSIIHFWNMKSEHVIAFQLFGFLKFICTGFIGWSKLWFKVPHAIALPWQFFEWLLAVICLLLMIKVIKSKHYDFLILQNSQSETSTEVRGCNFLIIITYRQPRYRLVDKGLEGRSFFYAAQESTNSFPANNLKWFTWIIISNLDYNVCKSKRRETLKI